MKNNTAAPPAQSRRGITKQQKSWFWYDWANSAYVTTTATVLIGPYLTHVAKTAACPSASGDALDSCTNTLSVLGVPISPGSLVPYTFTVSTLISAVVLIFIGAIADRHPRPTKLLGAFAWIGALAATSMFFISGSNWQLGVILILIANLSLGASLVVYDALLIRIATPDERDDVSSRGWALGYLGGGLLLLINLGMVSMADAWVGTEMSIRLSLLSAGLWWGVFTIIPVRGLWKIKGLEIGRVSAAAGTVGGSFKQLADTFKTLRTMRLTMLFLVAYLFFNDGVQTVISSSALYGSEELKLDSSQLMMSILMVQFVAFFGARIFGMLAARLGAKKAILIALVIWIFVIIGAFLVPANNFSMWMVAAVPLGIVLGGIQALSRSLYSQMVPAGKESEFFSLYQAMERGTSWLGTFTFGLTYQLTGSYRSSIIILIAFFVIGGSLLLKVDVKAAIKAAGNPVPKVV